MYCTSDKQLDVLLVQEYKYNNLFRGVLETIGAR
jgi:hypothetical protein